MSAANTKPFLCKRLRQRADRTRDPELRELLEEAAFAIETRDQRIRDLEGADA